MEIRDKLVRLHGLNIGPKICDIYGATVDDLELLAIAEDELKPQEEADHGAGPDIPAEREG